MQLSFNRRTGSSAFPLSAPRTSRAYLADLREGESAVIDAIELPKEFAHRLMELGFLPGATVEAARCAPGGDPRVFRVDGTEIALRRETAGRVTLQR